MARTREELVAAYEPLCKQFHLLPVAVTPFYKKKVDEEIAAIGPGGPLYKCVYPTEAKVGDASKGIEPLHGPGEVEDFVQEYNHYPVAGNTDIVRQYSNRLLFMTTEHCCSNCAYCFRTIKLAESDGITIENSLDQLIEYVDAHKELEEVILSGGDPVLVPLDKLRLIFEKIKSINIPHIRLHTRSIVYNPYVITQEFIDLMAEFDVRVVFHIMHPYEIDDVVKAKVEQFRKANVRMYNQNPILAGINDSPFVLKKLFTMLDDMRIRQMSIFTPDIIAFSATYRIPYQKICDIFDYMNYHSSAWVNSVRLVSAIPPGKGRRENIKKWDKETGVITFEINGVEFEYVDFPEELYHEPEHLLWKEELGLEKANPRL
ncbi:MAG: radical SAM protein [Mogibacterium sp.]|nr:radical SAM protein [Mogibacterium sp.]